jgi:hypothetical protein
MSSALLDSLFEPPKFEVGDHVSRKDADLPRRYHGVIASVNGWFAFVQWNGIVKPSREYTPDLEAENGPRA